jgi:predicted O-linked N-acetylglucosamine transferase (SPINDLY family)
MRDRSDTATAPGAAPAVVPDVAAARREVAVLRRAALEAGARARWPEASALLVRALAAAPADASLHAHHGVVLRRLGRLDDAVRAHRCALALEPGRIDTRYNLGNALLELGQADAALAEYDGVLRARPGHADAAANRCLALLRLQRADEALAGYRAALAARPDDAGLRFGLGNALAAAGRHAEALAAFDGLLAIDARRAAAWNNRGNALLELGRPEQALASYERALAVDPQDADALLNRARMLAGLRRHDDALHALSDLLRRRPERADAWCAMGNALQDLRRLDGAITRYDRALALDPAHAESLLGRANARAETGALDAAITDYEAFLRLRPAQPFVTGQWLHTRMRACDWRALDAARRALADGLARGEPLATPLAIMGMLDDPGLQGRAAQAWADARHPPDGTLGPIAPRAAGGRIRVGYFSADFHDHPVAHLVAGILEQHDRAAFEVVAFSFGSSPPDDPMRRRVVAAVDRFVDVRGMSDLEVARAAREIGIDVAIDLGGFTLNSRTGIFARRAAPVQASYLGFLGTMGASFIDYLIADRVIVPDDAARAHYREQVVRLPSYQVSDAHRPRPSREFTRAALGLPEQGVVFCCFSNLYKFTPEVFDRWMRILVRVPESVLFLYADRPEAAARLRAQAAARGVDPARLVFGERLPLPEYLARYRCADLFLDTAPYNAGTTASDALWAGLPVLTCAGRAFSARVAASVLTAAGLPELIAADGQDYEDRAVALAHDPARRASIRARLEGDRAASPLFDAARFTRSLERAYAAMHARARAGEPPAAIDVAAGDAGPAGAAPSVAEAARPPPGDPRAQGLAAAARGDWGAALEALERAARARPEDARTHTNLGVVLRRLGRLEDAAAAQRRAVALAPDFADAQYNLGNVLQALGRLQEALGHYDAALRLRPDHGAAATNRGLTLQALGRSEDAVTAFEQAVRIDPRDPSAAYNLGNALAARARHAEAERAYARAIDHDPRHASACNNRGNALLELGRAPEALACYERALEIAPDHADARVNLANALTELRRAGEALAGIDTLLAREPHHALGRCARGNALHALRRWDEALHEFDLAIASDAAFAQARLNRALCLLRLGRFTEAWPDYEWRWRTAEVAPLRRDFGPPQWTGAEPLAGRTVLLHAEQGLGDTLQFCRYVPRVAALGARVIVEVPPRLAALVRTLPGAPEVIARGAPLPAFDLHCPLLSLPRAFGTTVETLPAAPRYLRAEPARVARWAARLAQCDGAPSGAPRVGVMWRGGSGSRIRGRSIAAHAFLAALPRGPRYVSLQRELPAEDLEAIATRPDLVHFGDEQEDFGDAAALCASVDLVVSVDTSVAHLAGALGRTLWLLLPGRCDWRWFDDREDSPWYPSATLLRQRRDGDWSDVLERLTAELRARYG